MPTCPACGRSVAYRRLTVHERHCEKLGDDRTEAARVESLDRRLESMENQLNRRLRKLEANIRAYQTDQEQNRDRSSRRESRR